MPQKTSKKISVLAIIFLLCAGTASAIIFAARHEYAYVPSLAYLYVLPIAASAYVFGLNSAVRVSLFCCALYAPVVLREFSVSAAEGIEESLDFVLFIITGVVSGVLSERIKKETEHAYFHARLEEIAASTSFDVEALSSSFQELLSQAGDNKQKTRSPYARNLLRSLREACDVHLQKTALVREILTSNELLETILTRVPFGVLRLSGEKDVLYKNEFLENDNELLKKTRGAIPARAGENGKNEFMLSHNGREFLMRKFNLTAAENEPLILVQDMEEKRSYERARENYRLKTVFLSHVTDAFMEKVSVLERDFHSFEASENSDDKKISLAASQTGCAALLNYVDELLERVKDNAEKP